MSRRIVLALGALLVVVPVAVALLGPFLAPAFSTDGRLAPFAASPASPFGTDRLGRDVLFVALSGGHSLLLTAAVTVGWAYAAGFALGMCAAATRRRWLTELIVRPLDVLLCLPTLVIVMVVALRSQGSAVAVSAAVGFCLVAPIARFVRTTAARYVHDPVTDALRLQRAGWRRIHVAYVGRRMLRPIAADVGARLSAALYIVAAANFLGLGFDIASPDWAVSVSTNRDGLSIAPWSVMLPAALIVSLVLGLNMFWDALFERRDSAATARPGRAARVGRLARVDPAAPGARPAISSGDSADVRVRGLAVRAADGTPLVEGVHLDLRPGRVTALAGPSGAGKTSVARTVLDALSAADRTNGGGEAAGLEVSGTIEVPDRRPRVGYLPQHAAETLNPARRVGAALRELLALAARRDGRRPGRAELDRDARALLAAVDLGTDDAERTALCRRHPFEFSGGQRTRLALAQVLAIAPEILVLDEPTSGLDPANRDTLVGVLSRLRAEGVAQLLITHDTRVADALADSVVRVGPAAVAETARAHAPGSESGARGSAPLAPSAPARVVLRAEGLELSVGATPVASGIDLEVRSGEFLGIIGRSGAGKSTLARTLLGLHPPRHGRMLYTPADATEALTLGPVAQRDRATVADIQYVWQEAAASFEPWAPILRQVAQPATYLRGAPEDRARREAAELLEAMGIDEAAARRSPSGLSGGQLRRAALARALASRPRILIADELTTGLDEPRTLAILELLRRYREDTGAALVLISHDHELVHGHADRVLELTGGRLAEAGAEEDPAFAVIHEG